MSRHSDARSGTGEWLVGAMTRNPEGLLLLAAGAALLMRSSSTFMGRDRGKQRTRGPGSGQASVARQGHHQAVEMMERERDRTRGMTENVARAAQAARDYTSDAASRMTDTAASYASAVGEYASDTGRSVAEQSGRFARQAQETVSETINRVVQEQPLAIALAGLAAGAAVAAAFPATDIERRTLGQAGDKLTGYASETGERLRDATYAAGERLLNTVEEQGLSTEGLKDAASDVAGTFGETFSGQGREQPGQGARPGKSGRAGPDVSGAGA